jgi:xanthine dehydrogenase YagT iron-sulfur-binding subunit
MAGSDSGGNFQTSGKRRRGISRRGFITGMGAGAVCAVAAQAAGGMAQAARSGEDAPPKVPGGAAVRVTLRVNDRQERVLVEPRWSLLFVLRERLGLTAAKEGCGRGECGACTVLLDGVPHYACMVLAVEAEGRDITTLEGLMDGEALNDVQQAFLEEDAFQCGYCTSGQIVAAEGLLRARPQPDQAEVRRGMSGNLCRCGAYTHIFRAVHGAADKRKG